MIRLKKAPALFLLGAIVLFLLLFLLKIENEMVDFGVNYRTGKRAWLNETLYRQEDGHYQFKYPPFCAYLYLPLSFLPLSVAKGIWYSIILVSLGSTLFLSAKLAKLQGKEALWISLFTCLILARYFFRELQLGQINALMTWILLLLGKALVEGDGRSSRKGEKIAGLLWGIAVSLKPYALVFFPYFIIKKKFLALRMGILFLIIAALAPSLFFGFSGNLTVHREWITTFSRSTAQLLDSQDNISLLAMFTKWTHSPGLSLFFYLLALILIGLGLFYFIQKKEKEPSSAMADVSCLLILIPLISPLGWDYTLLSSAPGIILILHHFSKFPRLLRPALVAGLATVGLSLYDIMGRKNYAAFMSWSVITLIFLLLLGYLSYLRFKDQC